MQLDSKPLNTNTLEYYAKLAKSRPFLQQIDDDINPIAISCYNKDWPWLISIGGLNQRMGMPNHEFVGITRNQDCNKLFVRDATRLWYQKGLNDISHNFDSTGIFLRALLDHLQAVRKIAIGNSAGGYAAIGWAEMVDFDSVLVFSPQSTIRFADILRSDRRWVKFVWPAWLRSATTLDLTNKKYFSANRNIRVLYSENFRPDRYQAERLQYFDGVTLDPRNSTKHSLVKQLRDSGELSTIIQEAFIT